MDILEQLVDIRVSEISEMDCKETYQMMLDVLMNERTISPTDSAEIVVEAVLEGIIYYYEDNYLDYLGAIFFEFDTFLLEGTIEKVELYNQMRNFITKAA